MKVAFSPCVSKFCCFIVAAVVGGITTLNILSLFFLQVPNLGATLPSVVHFLQTLDISYISIDGWHNLRHLGFVTRCAYIYLRVVTHNCTF